VPVRTGPPLIAGCRIPGCCPGCGVNDTLSWRLQVSGPPGSQVVLEFERQRNLAGRLRVEGGAHWRDDHTLLVPAGESWVHGLSFHSAKSPMTALPAVIGAAPASATTRSLDQPAPASMVRFTVVQYLSEVPVNHAEMAFDLRDLGLSPAKAEDIIDLHNNRQGDSAIILVDGWRESGFVNDEIYRAADRANVGNLLPILPECQSIFDRLEIKRARLRGFEVSPATGVPERENTIEHEARRLGQDVRNLEVQLDNCGQCPYGKQCNSEAIVFSNGDAMAFDENIDVWTSAPNDVFYARLGSTHKIPVTFWILPDQAVDPQAYFELTRTRILSDQLRANQIFEEYNCGIAFTTAAINDVGSDPGPALPIGPDCLEANRLSDEIGHIQGHINIYYLPQVPETFDAITCPPHTVLILQNAINEALAHEYGHWLTLGHVDGFDLDNDGLHDFPQTNLMMSGGLVKYELTEGQCFRMNVSPYSVLNSLGYRTGPTRKCRDIDINADCPAVFLDVKPD